MSRPIYEPSLPRADADLGYGNRQLFRRPAPVSADSILSLAWIFHGPGSVDIPPDVAYDITTEGGAGANPYDEGFVSEPNNAGFSVNLDDGEIEWEEDGEYLIVGGFQVESDLNGEVFSPLLQFAGGGGKRVANPMPGTSTSASEVLSTSEFRVTEVEDFVNLGSNRTVKLWAWHTDSPDAAFSNFRLHVVQLRLSITGTFYP